MSPTSATSLFRAVSRSTMRKLPLYLHLGKRYLPFNERFNVTPVEESSKVQADGIATLSTSVHSVVLIMAHCERGAAHRGLRRLLG